LQLQRDRLFDVAQIETRAREARAGERGGTRVEDGTPQALLEALRREPADPEVARAVSQDDRVPVDQDQRARVDLVPPDRVSGRGVETDEVRDVHAEDPPVVEHGRAEAALEARRGPELTHRLLPAGRRDLQQL